MRRRIGRCKSFHGVSEIDPPVLNGIEGRENAEAFLGTTMTISSKIDWDVCVVATLLLLTVACGRGNPPVSHADSVETPSDRPVVSQPAAAAEKREESPPSAPSGGIEERLARETWHGDLDGIAKRRFLRVLVAPSKLGFTFDGLHMQGAIYEFTREFETFLNKKLNTGNLAIDVVFVPVARERLLPMLADGKGDLVASLMAVPEKEQNVVEFSDPLYDKANVIIVTGPGSPPVSSLEDLSGKEIYCHKNTASYEKLSELSKTFQSEGKASIQLTPADEDLQPEDLLEMVNAGLVPMTVSEDRLLTVLGEGATASSTAFEYGRCGGCPRVGDAEQHAAA